ncbi:MAG: hypothetical protein JW982_09130 [Spirochaetes bacterium]|nr:hypothetical protein [Spirochaetota bacterium]
MRKFFIACILFVNCSILFGDTTFIKESVEIKEKTNIMYIYSNSSLKTSKQIFSIKNLFDTNINNYWITKFDKKFYEDGVIKIVFKKPVYVRKLFIRNKNEIDIFSNEKNLKIKSITIEKVIVGGRSYPLENNFILEDNDNIQEISLEKKWTNSINMFKIKEIIINIDSVYGLNKTGFLSVSDLKILTDDELKYVPKYKWFDLYQIIVKNRITKGENWYWDDLMNKNIQCFTDLLYYVLKGEADAKTVFSSYKTDNIGEEEALTYIYRPAIKEMLSEIN